MTIWRYSIVVNEVWPGRIARTARDRLLKQVRTSRYRLVVAESAVKEQDPCIKHRASDIIR